MNPNAKILADRIRRIGATGAEQIATNVETAFGVATNFAAKAKAIRDNPRLSKAGHDEEIGRALKGGPLGHLAQLRGTVADQLDAVKAKRAHAMQPPSPTAEQRAGDMVGELQRAEIRAWLRGLEPAERLRTVLEAKEPAIREAALLAPPQLSGLSNEHRGMLIDKIAQEKHGPALRAWEREEDALQTAAAAIDQAERELFSVAGVEKSAVSP